MKVSPCSFCGGRTDAEMFVPPELSFCPSCVDLVRNFENPIVMARLMNAANEGRDKDVLSIVTARKWLQKNSRYFGATGPLPDPPP